MTPSGMNDVGAPMDQAAAPAPMDDKGQSGTDQDCVPLAALNMPDESEQMTSPEVGDKVQYTVEGTVSKITGDQAYVDREAINGQPVGNQAPKDQNPAEQPPEADGQPEPDADDAAGLDELRNQAKGMSL